MKNKKVIIIGVTSVIVLGLLYTAFKKASVKDITNDAQLKADYDALIKKIDNAKK
jgi:hypothetical protein